MKALNVVSYSTFAFVYFFFCLVYVKLDAIRSGFCNAIKAPVSQIVTNFRVFHTYHLYICVCEWVYSWFNGVCSHSIQRKKYRTTANKIHFTKAFSFHSLFFHIFHSTPFAKKKKRWIRLRYSSRNQPSR